MNSLTTSQIRSLQEICERPDLDPARFDVQTKLGRGGMGTVWQVFDHRLERDVAVKVVNLELAEPASLLRLHQEAKILAHLEHPGIVPIHDLGTLPDGRTFYVMKRVDGQTFEKWMLEGHRLGDRLRLMIRITEIVGFAHSRGIIHRDLKPANLMVGRYGEVFVMDFGIAKTLDLQADTTKQTPSSENTTTSRVLIGTPAWMAPEQIERRIDDIDHRTDIWALGAILEVLIRTTPDASLSKGAQRRLLAVVTCAKAHDPSHRYAAALDFAADLRSFLDGRPLSAYPESWLDRISRWIDTNRFLVFLILGYMILRGLVAVIFGR